MALFRWKTAVFVVFASLAVQAVNPVNPNLFPLGFEEALLGNAGVALAGSPGNPYFNPAGISKSSRFEISGSAQAAIFTTVDLDDFQTISVVENNAVGTVPSTFVSSFGTGRYGFAFSVFTPTKGSLDFEVSVNVGDLTSTSLISIQAENVVLGPSVSVQVSKKLSLGLTAFGEVLRENAFATVRTVNSLATEGSIHSIRTMRTVYGMHFVLGARYKFLSNLALGLRVQTPLLQFSGTTDGYQATQTESGGVFNTEEISKFVDANHGVPWDVTTGLSWRQRNHLFVTDVGVSLPLDVKTIDGEPFTIQTSYHLTARGHLGYRYSFSRRIKLLTGFQFNPDTTGEESHSLNFSTGLSFLRKTVKTVLGVVYSKSEASGTETAGGSTIDRDVTRHTFMGFFGSTFYF